ncbi:MAG: hypothetical protein H7Y08_07565 [Rhizobiaceae bacterium]|nr:hypothetical protein [Rhizobiaceae bacterium]
MPDGRSAEELGLSAPRALQRLDPIALPDVEGSLDSPALRLPALPAYAPQQLPLLDIIRTRKTLLFEARLAQDGDAVPSGLVWRLFSPIAGPEGKLPLVASARGGSAAFEVPRGTYLLHVGFGRAGVTKRVEFSGEQTREIVVLDAGGLTLNALAAGDVPIPQDTLTFDIFSDAPEERDRQLIADDVAPKTVVELNAGTYHVVSNFGSVNAVVRADVTVEPGKLTDVTLQHRAAQLTMKLVREKGGEAIADTAWTISSASGDLVRESVGAFPSMVLAEGDYLIVAKNKDRVYQRDFEVVAGVNTDVEVLTTNDLIAAPDTTEGSGD